MCGEVWEKIVAEQSEKGMERESEKVEEERENACYEYAEEKSYKIIDDEWKPDLKMRGYCFIDRGYDSGGLYGRTWALFQKDI